MLKTVKKTVLIAIFGLGLSACANVYNDAKMAAPGGDAYSKALYKEMMAIADYERAEEDWTSANYHGGRALTVANGGTIEPTDPNMRRLNRFGTSGASRAEITQGYDELNGVLQAGGASKDPAAMAKAFAGYECWYEQSSEGHQPNDIATCKDQYDTAMAALTARPSEPGVCFYPIDGDKVDFNCEAQINEIADQAVDGGQVVVQGHADTLGSPQYNLDLSKRRAQGVVAVLNQLGISTDRMTVGAVGEAELRVATPDNTAEQENRAVVMRVVK